MQPVLTVCINNTTLEKKAYFEPDYSKSEASPIVAAKPPQRDCSPTEDLCGARSTAPKGSPAEDLCGARLTAAKGSPPS
jgi:hypothetical protein